MNNNNKLPSYNSITDHHHHHLLRGEDGREDSLVYSACTTVSDDGSVLTEEEEDTTTSAITPDYYFEQDPSFHGRHNRYYQSSDASTTTGGSSSVPPPPPPPLPHPSWRKHQPSNVYHRRRSNHNKSTKTKCSNVLYWTYVAGFLALGSITLSILMIVSSANNNNNDNDLMNWITTTKEIGMKGRRAQNIADQSSIIVGMSNPRRSASSSSSSSSSAGSTNQEQQGESITGDDDAIPLLGSSKKNNNKSPLLQDSLVVEEGCEATVMIIRHCERGNLKSHCNYLGYERAKYLQTLFGNEPKDLWPLPSQIYAMKTNKEHSKDNEHVREVETVQFVATKSELDIVAGFGSNQIKTLANTIIANITSGDMCGKLILVSWKHADIPQLANHLGCGPLQGCPVDYKGELFDPVWQIKYVYRNFMSDQQQKTSSKKNNNKSTTKSSSSNYWDMFGTVQSQNFDPLAFSKRYGDYPLGGTSKGGRWNTYDNDDGDGDGDVVVSNTISSKSSSSSSVVKQFYG